MKPFLTLITCLTVTNMLLAQAGTIDSSFGKNGIIVNDTFPNVYYTKVGQLPDGRLLVSGGIAREYSLFACLLPDGRLDTSFGIGGFAPTSLDVYSVYDFALQPDGRIVGVSSIFENDTIRTFVTRTMPNGMPDPSFGTNGIAFVPYFKDGRNGNSVYNKIALEPDGSIILGGAGTDIVESLDTRYMLLVHISKDGVFDYAFGGTGRVLNNAGVRDEGLAIQKDGKILICGYTFNRDNYIISRYNIDGSLDKTFSDDGNEITDGLGGEDEPGGIIIQPDGRIVIAGYSNGDRYYMSALRHNEDGTLDKSFGGTGKVFVPFGDSAARAFTVALQADGKLLLTGATYDVQHYKYANIALSRLNASGSVDSSFGTDGRVVTAYNNEDDAHCLALQQDGKIVIGGNYHDDNTGDNYSLLIRYLGDGKGQHSIIAKIKCFLHNHGITWNGTNNGIAYYSIERNSGAGFREVSRVRSNANQQEYNYIIPSASSSNTTLSATGYYRVRAVSSTGGSNLSNVVAVNNSDDAQAISIYPNPASNVVTIKGLNASMKYNVSISDVSGTVYLSSIIKQQTTSKLDVSKLKRGSYVLNISNNTTSTALKFVKE